MVGRRVVTVVTVSAAAVCVIGVAGLWYFRVRGLRQEWESASFDTLDSAVVLVDEGRPVTFPAVNRWDAPLVPLEPGYFARFSRTIRRTVGADTEPTYESVADKRVQCEVLVTRSMLPVLRALQKMSSEQLRAKSSSLSDGYTPLLRRDGGPSRLALLVLLATPPARPDRPPTVVQKFTVVLPKGDANLIPDELATKWLQEWYEKDGFACVITSMPGTPERGLRVVPLFPKMGQELEGDTDCVTPPRFVARQTVSLGGGIFRCWVVEHVYEQGPFRGRIRRWYAPGLGLVMIMSVQNRIVRRNLLDLGEVRRTIYEERLEELLLPNEGTYWAAK